MEQDLLEELLGGRVAAKRCASILVRIVISRAGDEISLAGDNISLAGDGISLAGDGAAAQRAGGLFKGTRLTRPNPHPSPRALTLAPPALISALTQP